MTRKLEHYDPEKFFNKIIGLLKDARTKVLSQVNTVMVNTYFEIGRMIVEEEQAGKGRAEYGKQLIRELSGRLSSEFGKGFSVTNLQQMRNFYLIYQKQQTLSVKFKLSWSHYLKLMRIDNENVGKKNDTLVEITLPENNEQIFASKYETVLPSKYELKQLIEGKED